MTYDPLGRLAQTTGGSAGTTKFLWDGNMLIAEYNASNGLLRRYVHGAGIDEPIAWLEGAGTTDRRWLHADERGSTIGISNGAGTSIAVNAYDEYGIPQSTNLGRFQYTGQAWMPELGLYYYKARVYSATLGRFMQTDPIGYEDGLNWYNYVGSDPINANDPSGLDSCNDGTNDICVTGRRQSSPLNVNSTVTSGGYALQVRVISTQLPKLKRIVENFALRSPAECASDATFSTFKDAANAAFRANPMQLKDAIWPFSALRGIRIHVQFAGTIKAIGGLYDAEVSYKDGLVVPYGTFGSVRADGVYGSRAAPLYVVELKSGFAVPTFSEIMNYQRHLPPGTPICGLLEAPGAE